MHVVGWDKPRPSSCSAITGMAATTAYRSSKRGGVGTGRERGVTSLRVDIVQTPHAVSMVTVFVHNHQACSESDQAAQDVAFNSYRRSHLPYRQSPLG